MLLMKILFSNEVANTPKKRKNNILKLKVLKTIFENRTIAINEIAAKVNLSLPTLNLIVNELINEGLLEQKDKGDSIGGRKPNLYQVKSQTLNVLSIEIDRFNIRVVVIDNNNSIVHKSRKYQHQLSKEAIDIQNVVDLIYRYASEENIDWTKITVMGILMPGLTNAETGENLTYYKGPGFNLQKHLEKIFRKDVYLLNDVKSAALSELKYGAAIGQRNVLIIQMDWGIGLGIIINGEVYMGNEGFSGEVGHMVFVEDGQLCYCGKRGCLETVASGIALVNTAKRDISAAKPTLLSNKYDVDNLLPTDIIEAANLGDQYAIDLINTLGSNLGKAFSQLIQLFNPQRIVISGKFVEAGSLITLPIQLAIETYTMNALKKNCTLHLSTLGENGAVKGIILYSINKYLDDLIRKMEHEPLH